MPVRTSQLEAPIPRRNYEPVLLVLVVEAAPSLDGLSALAQSARNVPHPISLKFAHLAPHWQVFVTWPCLTLTLSRCCYNSHGIKLRNRGMQLRMKEIDGLEGNEGRKGRKGHAFDRRPPAFLDLNAELDMNETTRICSILNYHCN